MMNSIIMISIGGALGCLLRWWLGISLSAFFPYLSLGILVANYLAAYLIGIAIALFTIVPALTPWRLFVITGFLGGLSTFSSFSVEIVQSMQEGRLMWAGVIVITHVVGAILLTFGGIASVYWLRSLLSI